MSAHTIPTTPVEVLDRTIALLSDPANWTTDYFARNAKGQDVDVRSPDATCFCIMGAIERVTRGPENGERVTMEQIHTECDAEAALHAVLTKRLGDSNIAIFNDSASHEQVIEALTEARDSIKRA